MRIAPLRCAEGRKAHAVPRERHAAEEQRERDDHRHDERKGSHRAAQAPQRHECHEHSHQRPAEPRRQREKLLEQRAAAGVHDRYDAEEQDQLQRRRQLPQPRQPLPRHEHRVHLRDAGAGNDVHQRQPKHRQQRHRRKHAEQSPAAERAEKLPQLLPRHIACAEKGACKGQADAARVPLLLFQIRSPPLFLP